MKCFTCGFDFHRKFVLNLYCKDCRKLMVKEIIKVKVKTSDEILLEEVAKELHMIRLQTRLQELEEERIDYKYF